jgi:hypothetical protein
LAPHGVVFTVQGEGLLPYVARKLDAARSF